MKKTIPFMIASDRIKYLGINFNKKVKDLYIENYNTLMKKLKKTQINGKILHISCIRRVSMKKFPYCLKQFTDSMQSLSKFQ